MKSILKNKVIKLREQGKSYSQIKDLLGVSKSTLSSWISDMPLSKKQIDRLRGRNPIRIEKFRNTMRKKKDARLSNVYEKVSLNIGNLSTREKFIAGFFLYWAEGGKTMDARSVFANTDPSMIVFFIKWLKQIKIDSNLIFIKLHLYSDMDINKEIKYWSSLTKIPINRFKNSYIKDSKLSERTYKNGFNHGTCNIVVAEIDFNEYILMSVKYLRDMYIRL